MVSFLANSKSVLIEKFILHLILNLLIFSVNMLVKPVSVGGKMETIFHLLIRLKEKKTKWLFLRRGSNSQMNIIEILWRLSPS